MANYCDRKKLQIVPQNERQWIEQNRLMVMNAGLNMFNFMNPTTDRSLQEILTTVESWAFQPEGSEVDTNLIQQDSVLSLAEQGVRDSYVETRNGLGWEEESVSEIRTREATETEMTQVQRERIFEGRSYRLVIQSN